MSDAGADAPHPLMPAPAGGADVTVIHLDAGDPALRWAADRWAVVADAERRRGRRVYLCGAAPARAEALVVARWAGLPDSNVLAGRLDAGRLTALVAAAGRVITADPAVCDLAAAYGTTALRVDGESGVAAVPRDVLRSLDALDQRIGS